MFEESIGATTTFWSHDEMVKMIRDNNDGFKNLQALNEAVTEEIKGVKMYVKYENVTVGVFEFGDLNFDQDTVTWKYAMDATNKYKFRLDIQNVYGAHGAMVPREIQIKPEGYDKSWKMSWRYKRDTGASTVIPGIELFWVDGDMQFEHLIYTLWHTNFGQYGEKWLRNNEPIIIEKHETYITIRCSAHMSSHWSIMKSYHDRNPQEFLQHVMSDDEAAWIFGDSAYAVKKTETRPATAPRQGPRPGPGARRMGAMLATLRHLAE
jgi:hypothetical protein